MPLQSDTCETKPETAYCIVFKAQGSGPPVGVRLRRFLKNALRAYGLRCTSIGEASHAQTCVRQSESPSF